MDFFNYHNNELYAEEVPVLALADTYGTPLYIYSRATLERHYKVFDEALGDHPHKIHFAVKANSNIAVLNVLAKLGAGFDIVSIGELERVLAAGGKPEHIIFSGVGKLKHEIERALETGIGCFNIESAAELERIQEIAHKKNKTARIAFRVNPNVDAKTHPYISTGLKQNKFGVSLDAAEKLYETAHGMQNLNVTGIACHIGSQLLELNPLLEAFDKIYAFAEKLGAKGINIEHLDIGGGLGVPYLDETPPTPQEYANALRNRIKGKKFTLHLEPGRAIAANAGILVTRVEYLKHHEEKNFAVVDAAMNDLLRPALYQAFHNIIPAHENESEKIMYDVVGPVCETGDFIGKDRLLAIKPMDYLAIRSTGAYGFTMSSNYNSRPRAAEIMVDGNKHHIIRERESLSNLFAHEHLIHE